METTSLVLNIGSDSVKTATGRLDELNKTSKAVSKTSQDLGQAVNKTGASIKEASEALDKNGNAISAANAQLGRFVDAQGKLREKTGQYVKGVEKATSKTGVFSKALARVNNAAPRTAKVFGRIAGASRAATSRLGKLAKTSLRVGGALGKAGVKAGGFLRGLTSLGGGAASLLGPVLALLGPLVAMKKVFESTVELQNWQAELTTATGSTENAAIAFENLESFASSTPFKLEQSIEAFQKLTNLGLTPSREALESYGNTASAMGKDLTQLIEAAADATTGEFERLKEFGIKSKSEGDNVTFTFRGVEKTIKKDAASIEGYLINLGKTEFADAMVNKMNTVGGKVSNLGDLWDKLFRVVSEAGVGSIISDALDLAINGLNEFIAMLQSGQLEGYLKAIGEQFKPLGELAGAAFDFIGDIATSIFGDMAVDGDSAFKAIISAFTELPNRLALIIKFVGIEIANIVLYVINTGKKIIEKFSLAFGAVIDLAKTAGSAIGAGLNPFSDETFAGTLAAGFNAALAKVEKGGAEINKEFERSEKARTKVRNDALQEAGAAFEKTQKRFTKTISEADKARERWDLARVAKEKALGGTDQLAGFKIEPPEGTQTPEEKAAAKKAEKERQEFYKQLEKDQKKADKAAETSKKKATASAIKATNAAIDENRTAFESLVENLRAEENAIEGSYLARIDLIRKNTTAGSSLRAELSAKAQEDYQNEIESFKERQISELDVKKNGFSLELEEIDIFYQKRKDLILANESLTETEKTELVAGLSRERNELVRNLEVERSKQGLSIANDYFGNFTSLAKSSNKKLASIGRAALVAQKAIAITQATIKTYESATSAYASLAGVPVVGPALGAAAAGAAIAAGLANVSAISSTNASVGSFENGGIVPGGSFSGDRLTANVNSAEMILNRQQQANLFDLANGRGARNGGNVTIINQSGNPVEGSANVDENGDVEIILKEAVRRTTAQLTKEATNGGGSVIPALQQTFGLRRQGA